jgi:hypothetical protein
MVKIETNIPHLKSNLGVWRKVYALTRGHVSNIKNINRGDLWSVGLSPDFWVIIDAVKSWKVPFHVVMSLWALRERQLNNGGFLRHGELSRYIETGTVYRYIELALLSGETPKDDIYMRRAINWLLEHQLEDGSFPTHETSSIGEVGTTGRTIRILSMALQSGACSSPEKIVHAIKKGLDYLRKKYQRHDDYGWWSRTERDNEKGIVGASSLAVLAILSVREFSDKHSINIPFKPPIEIVEPTLNWLLMNFNEIPGWPESSGECPKIDTTFYALWALLWAWENGILLDFEKIRLKILDALEKHHSLIRGTLYDTSFVLRFLALLTKYRKVLGISEKQLRALIRKYTHRLLSDIGIIFKTDSDTYLMELIGISLLEVEKAMRELEMEEDIKKLYNFPGMPPSFMLKEILEKSKNASDVLYLLINPKTKWRPFISFIDTLVKMDILSIFIGIVVGLLVIINDFSEMFFKMLLFPQSPTVELASFLTALLLTVVWLWIKLIPEKSRLEATMSYTLATLTSYFYLIMFLKISGMENFPDTLTILKTLLLLAIIIDVTVKLLDATVFSKILGG